MPIHWDDSKEWQELDPALTWYKSGVFWSYQWLVPAHTLSATCVAFYTKLASKKQALAVIEGLLCHLEPLYYNPHRRVPARRA